jgi:hypothetical protein
MAVRQASGAVVHPYPVYVKSFAIQR